MAFVIKVKGRKSIAFISHKKARLHEAFCAGMQKDYTLIYPNSDTKRVLFKRNMMNTVKELDEVIEKLKTQMAFLETDKNISDSDRKALKNYYETSLNINTRRKSALEQNKTITSESALPSAQP